MGLRRWALTLQVDLTPQVGEIVIFLERNFAHLPSMRIDQGSTYRYSSFICGFVQISGNTPRVRAPLPVRVQMISPSPFFLLSNMLSGMQAVRVSSNV